MWTCLSICATSENKLSHSPLSLLIFRCDSKCHQINLDLMRDSNFFHSIFSSTKSHTLPPKSNYILDQLSSKSVMFNLFPIYYQEGFSSFSNFSLKRKLNLKKNFVIYLIIRNYALLLKLMFFEAQRRQILRLTATDSGESLVLE